MEVIKRIPLDLFTPFCNCVNSTRHATGPKITKLCASFVPTSFRLMSVYTRSFHADCYSHPQRTGLDCIIGRVFIIHFPAVMSFHQSFSALLQKHCFNHCLGPRVTVPRVRLFTAIQTIQPAVVVWKLDTVPENTSASGGQLYQNTWGMICVNKRSMLFSG